MDQNNQQVPSVWLGWDMRTRLLARRCTADSLASSHGSVGLSLITCQELTEIESCVGPGGVHGERRKGQYGVGVGGMLARARVL